LDIELNVFIELGVVVVVVVVVSLKRTALICRTSTLAFSDDQIGYNSCLAAAAVAAAAAARWNKIKQPFYTVCV
jgi:hypothetical protein